jgi:hypothetical protein
MRCHVQRWAIPGARHSVESLASGSAKDAGVFFKMSDENPLTRLGDLTKPATVLIEKISDAVGGVFKPWQIVRVARAEAEASQIQAESQITVTDLHRRAMRRFLEEEAKKQLNIEAITQKALPLLEDKSAPQNMADDWITNFFDKSRIVSDADMQQLWSRVLAGEANSPGAFAKKTVNLLADLDKSDAELFTRLCGFCWRIERNFVPLIFDVRNDIYEHSGINFMGLVHLESLGLIQFEALAGFKATRLPKRRMVSYYERPVSLTFQHDEGNDFNFGTVLFTRAGEELAHVCGSRPVEGFFDFVYDRWVSESLVPKRENEQTSSKTDGAQ